MYSSEKIRLTVISWDSYARMFTRAANEIPNISLNLFSPKTLRKSDETMQRALQSLRDADVVFLYRSSDSFWDDVLAPEIKSLGDKPVISIGHDPSFWLHSTVKPDIVASCYLYTTHGGVENFKYMLLYMMHVVCNIGEMPPPPAILPWEGIYHPQSEQVFKEKDDYLSWYKQSKNYTDFVGILFSRYYWLTDNTEMIDMLVEDFEQLGVGVMPIFTHSVKDDNMGSLGGKEVIEKYYKDNEQRSEINALVKLTSLYGRDATDHNVADSTQSATILEALGVPVFQPVFTTYKTQEEWEDDSHGLGSMTGWYVTLPEFEGVIEPLMIAVAGNEGDGTQKAIPLPDRCKRITGRVAKWIRLQKQPVQDRKIAFILHNYPCTSVEASVGGAANLDSLESVARIMQQMKAAGYNSNGPLTGKELMDEIMDRKAVSEFRWTSVNEIVKKGGCLKLLPENEYRQWFDLFPDKLKDRVNEVWGNPPGEEKEGVPPAMVFDNKIIISGIKYENIVICVQPKRGCAGARCDGTVCKILHDPDIPPPHQYFATYRYIENDFGADCIVHVGTHGNIEFLPGKGVGLSSACAPDAAIGTLPHLYIYNADNPPEGAIAKRRSYATLIDHIQVLMIKGGLTKEVEDLEQLLSEYQAAAGTNKSRAHQLEHLISEALTATNFASDIKYEHGMPFDEVARRAHEAISVVKNSQINKGLHIFGDMPEGENRVKYIASIFRADTENGLELRSTIFKLIGVSLEETLNKTGEFNHEWGMPWGQIAEMIDEMAMSFIQSVINGNDPIDSIKSLAGDQIVNPEALEKFNMLADTARDIDRRLSQSDEYAALLRGFDAKYIRTGPSGKITRGKYDVLPSGKNFYTLDIRLLPTRAAYRVGYILADSLIKKHQDEEGRLPENVAIYWNCLDILCCDGEGMGQIMVLMGVRPLWLSSGRVSGFEIIPLEELGRPRIDVTLRSGGIMRDCFPECLYYIDDVIRSVAALDEPPEMNFVRKHSLAKLKDINNFTPEEWEDATTRIFGTRPGTLSGSGVNLAVYASAWKDEQDLTDVFVYFNQFGYGKNMQGKEMPKSLISSLKTVDITFNKTYTDEYDLFGCCGYFGTHGGITVAARTISGKSVKAYYGDTRDTKNVGVRDLSGEVRRVVRSKLLNPKWIEGMAEHGYKGLGDISKMIGRVYGWEATTGEVDDWIFDDITRTYVLDDEMRKQFEEDNPWALEEIGRRLLEANERGLWDADEEVLNDLKNKYLEIEGWIEERMGDIEGDMQGGSIDILLPEDVANWGEKMDSIRKLLKSK
jgi:cobaltochelatase CobN